MKKRSKVLWISVLILGLILVGCGKAKEAATVVDFNTHMESAGFTITDATDQYPEGAVEAVSIAMNDNYKIEFYIVPSTEQAEGAYATNKATIEGMKEQSTFSSEKSVGLSNYANYHLTTDDGYYVVSRIENTFLYITAPVAHKDEIAELVSGLGY